MNMKLSELENKIRLSFLRDILQQKDGEGFKILMMLNNYLTG
jgi:hypothetical protein